MKSISSTPVQLASNAWTIMNVQQAFIDNWDTFTQKDAAATCKNGLCSNCCTSVFLFSFWYKFSFNQHLLRLCFWKAVSQSYFRRRFAKMEMGGGKSYIFSKDEVKCVEEVKCVS